MLGVSNCDECERGVLVLDCTSAPKKWKLGCNACDVIINIFKGASKVSVAESKLSILVSYSPTISHYIHHCNSSLSFLFSDKQCDECQSQLVTVLYKSDQTKFKDGTDEKTGCLFCLPDFVPLVEKHRAITTRPVQINTRGGRGGGRGGVTINTTARGGATAGGRGGRGGRAPKDKWHSWPLILYE